MKTINIYYLFAITYINVNGNIATYQIEAINQKVAVEYFQGVKLLLNQTLSIIKIRKKKIVRDDYGNLISTAKEWTK